MISKAVNRSVSELPLSAPGRAWAMVAGLLSLGAALQSVYLGAVGMAVPPVLAMLAAIAGFVMLAGGAPERRLAFGAIAAFSILMLALGSAELGILGRSDTKTTFGTVASALSAFALLCLYGDRPQAWFAGVRWALTIVVTFWYLQVAVYFLSGHYLDVVQLLTGEPSRYLSAKGLSFGGVRIPRFTGFYNEPGTYSTYTAILAAAWLRCRGRFDLLVSAAVASMFLSLSLFGIVLGSGLLLIALFFGDYRVKRAPYVVGALILGAALWYVVGDEVAERLRSNYSGLEFRLNMLGQLWHGSTAEILLGHGTDPSRIPTWFVSNDNGLWFWLTYSYGLSGLAMIAAFALPTILDRKGLGFFLLALVLITKVKFSYPAFWFFWVSLLLASQPPQHPLAESIRG